MKQLYAFLSFFLLSSLSTLCFADHGKANLEKTDNETILVFDGKDYMKDLLLNKTFDFSVESNRVEFEPKNNRISNFNESVANLGISYSLWTFCNLNTREFGFERVKDIRSRFLITENNSGNLFVQGVTISWAYLDNCRGRLMVLGRNDKPFSEDEDPAVLMEQKLGEINMEMMPQKPTVDIYYKLPQPMKYVAIVHSYPDDPKSKDKNEYEEPAAFSAFKIHFTKLNSIKLGDGEEISLPWSNKQEGMSLDTIMQMFVDENDNVDPDKDIKFFITPRFEGNTKPDLSEQPEWMTTHQWRLYQLLESDKVKEAGYTYDGYWPEGVEKIECKYVDPTLFIPAPCSGRYTLSVEPAKEGLEFVSNTLPLNIWADINNEYKWLAEFENGYPEDPVYSFGLNFINFTNEGKEGNILYYPTDPNWEGQPYSYKWANLHIPGLYDAEIYYRVTYSNSREINGRRNANGNDDGFELYTGEDSFNLEGLTKNNNALLEIKVKKNGAETPMIGDEQPSETSFIISLQDDPYNPDGPLAVEALNINDGEKPTYYDLNGIQIDGNNLKAGIYVMKKGNKTSKIIMK